MLSIFGDHADPSASSREESPVAGTELQMELLRRSVDAYCAFHSARYAGIEFEKAVEMYKQILNGVSVKDAFDAVN